MKPVRIKYYGLFSMTRRTYLLATLAAGVFAVVVFVVILVASDNVPPFSWPWEPMPANLVPGFGGWFYHHFWSIILLLLCAEAIDIFVTLRKFAAKEAEQEQEELSEEPL
jgi:hypothetical protein